MKIKNSALKIGGVFFAFLFWAGFADYASAQIVDDILLNKAAEGNVRAIIKLSGPVQYLRHFPDKKGEHLEIFFKILPNGSANDPWQGYEARTSPPSDLIPGFVVTVRDVTTEPKMVVEFSRAAEYSVRIGKDQRSFVITIKQDKVKPASEKKESVKEQKIAKTDVATPHAEVVTAAIAAAATPVAPAAIPETAAPETTNPVKDTPSPVTENVPPVVEAATGVAEAVPTTAAAETNGITASSGPAETPLLDTTKETDAQAETLMAKGHEALKINENGLAIETFNKVLMLPPNKYTQDAQEWIGIARENAGQKFKAKVEYETYLKAYTTGEGVARVKERLAKLATVQQQVQIAAKIETAKEKKEFQTLTNGSLSMNYYHGNNTTSQDGVASISATDQSMMITNINASLRSRNDRYDNRIVFQDTYNKNFLTTTGQSNPNRLGSIYYDFKDNQTNLSSRIGRQSPTGGGVMGRFDGISGGYGISQKWQATAALGQLSDYGSGSKPKFFSVGMGIANSARWGGSVYYVNQQTNGVSDRSALGGELRYFDETKNAFSMIDYDTFFNELNTLLLQGSYNDPSGTSYNFTLDHRKTPSLSLSNAMVGSTYSMQYALSPSVCIARGSDGICTDYAGGGATKEDLKKEALKRTATSNSASFGINKQIREKWQAGADINISRTSGLPEYGSPANNWDGPLVAATPSSGNNYGLNARLIGNGVFTAHDVTVFSVGYITSKSSKGENFSLSNHLTLNEKWTADSSLRFNLQNSYDATTGDATGKQTILSPSIRLAYQVKSNVSLDMEGGLEINNNTPTTGQSSKTSRKYYSLGGRWDF